jgi:2'-5' RNA ligase
MHNQPKTRRLFFALWPSAQTRQSIVESFTRLSLRASGRTVSSGYLHITLHFLGQVSAERQACMHDAARSIKAASFDLALDRFGYFPRAKVFWLGPRETPAGLTRLNQQLGTAITDCGYQLEPRSYTPHVTLRRKCARPELGPADFSIPWHVDEFVMVESTTTESGVHYQVIEKYALSCDNMGTR